MNKKVCYTDTMLKEKKDRERKKKPRAPTSNSVGSTGDCGGPGSNRTGLSNRGLDTRFSCAGRFLPCSGDPLNCSICDSK